MKKNWEEQEKLPIDEMKAVTEEERKSEAVVEAVLFTMGNSVELRQLAAAIEQDEETARKAVLRLKKRYDSEERGLQIIELENSYQMCTRPDYYENLIRVASVPKKQVLTDVVLETLSIIAYKQPVTKMEIEKIRGVKSDHAVNRLVEYNLVYEVGRLDAPGRPALFATTEEFLRRFGIGSTQNLPTPDPEAAAEIRMAVEEELKINGEENPVDIPLPSEELPGFEMRLAFQEAAVSEQRETGTDEGRISEAEAVEAEISKTEASEEEAVEAEILKAEASEEEISETKTEEAKLP